MQPDEMTEYDFPVAVQYLIHQLCYILWYLWMIILSFQN